MFTYAEMLDTPLGVTAWFGRAIFRDGTLDIPHDRQGWIDGDRERAELVKLLDPAMKDVRAKVAKAHYDGSAHNTLPLYWNPDTRLVVWGCCNGSYGYMYIGAWIEPEPDDEPEGFSCPERARFTGEPHGEKGQVTCGTCDRSWCSFCIPTPASQCPYCNGGLD